MIHKPTLICTFLILAATGTLLCGLVSASQAGKAYNRSDEELNAAYQKVLGIVTEPEDRRLLVAEQRAWLKFCDASVAFDARYFTESKGGMWVGLAMNEQRTKQLKRLLTPEAQEAHKPDPVQQ